MSKMEQRILFLEEKVNERIIEIHSKIESLRERDKFSEIVEFIILLVTAFKLILLGGAILIPWKAIRDFWVKSSMFQFLVKSAKRYKKSWDKSRKRKAQKEEEELADQKDSVLSDSESTYTEIETILDEGEEEEKEDDNYDEIQLQEDAPSVTQIPEKTHKVL